MILSMRYSRPLIVVTSAALLFAGACGPRAPAGREAMPEEPPAVAGVVDRAQSPPAEAEIEPLAIRFVSPNIGPPAGGNEVTIDGRGFDAYPRIAFGGVPAWIRSVTPTEIRVVVPPPARPVPAGQALAVDVTVTNPPGESASPVSEALARAYSYVGEATATPVAVAPGSASPAAEAAAGEPPAAGPSSPATDAVAQAGGGETGSPPTEEAAPAVPTLVASFSFEIASESEDCPPPGTGVSFTDRSTGGPTEWWWDLGDGTTSEEQHLEHCYPVAGMRSVTLTVSNDETSASTSKIVIAGME